MILNGYTNLLGNSIQEIEMNYSLFLFKPTFQRDNDNINTNKNIEGGEIYYYKIENHINYCKTVIITDFEEKDVAMIDHNL